MKEITMSEYNEIKTKFYRKHYGENGYHENSRIDEYGRIHKAVVFEDGANWYEITEKVTEDATVEKHGIKTNVKVSFYRTEVWNTEMGSVYLYEGIWEIDEKDGRKQVIT